VERWEYRRITVLWDPTDGDWFAWLTDGDTIQGFNEICNKFGQQGWELVNVAPATWDAIDHERDPRGIAPPASELGKGRTTQWRVSAYYCFFRRRSG
jgi:hypothetical protein